MADKELAAKLAKRLAFVQEIDAQAAESATNSQPPPPVPVIPQKVVENPYVAVDNSVSIDDLILKTMTSPKSPISPSATSPCSSSGAFSPRQLPPKTTIKDLLEKDLQQTTSVDQVVSKTPVVAIQHHKAGPIIPNKIRIPDNDGSELEKRLAAQRNKKIVAAEENNNNLVYSNVGESKVEEKIAKEEKKVDNESIDDVIASFQRAGRGTVGPISSNTSNSQTLVAPEASKVPEAQVQNQGAPASVTTSSPEAPSQEVSQAVVVPEAPVTPEVLKNAPESSDAPNQPEGAPASVPVSSPEAAKPESLAQISTNDALIEPGAPPQATPTPEAFQVSSQTPAPERSSPAPEAATPPDVPEASEASPASPAPPLPNSQDLPKAPETPAPPPAPALPLTTPPPLTTPLPPKESSLPPPPVPEAPRKDSFEELEAQLMQKSIEILSKSQSAHDAKACLEAGAPHGLDVTSSFEDLETKIRAEQEKVIAQAAVNNGSSPAVEAGAPQQGSRTSISPVPQSLSTLPRTSPVPISTSPGGTTTPTGSKAAVPSPLLLEMIKTECRSLSSPPPVPNKPLSRPQSPVVKKPLVSAIGLLCDPLMSVEQPQPIVPPSPIKTSPKKEENPEELAALLERRNKIIEGETVPQFVNRKLTLYAEFSEFSRKQIKFFTETFKKYDEDNDGFIDFNELKRMMEKMGEAQTHIALKDIIKKVDEDNDGKISQREFFLIFRLAAEGKLGCSEVFTQLAESVDVSKEGVLGAANFFQAKIAEQTKLSKFEEEIKQEQEERRQEEEEKKARREKFMQSKSLFH